MAITRISDVIPTSKDKRFKIGDTVLYQDKECFVLEIMGAQVAIKDPTNNRLVINTQSLSKIKS